MTHDVKDRTAAVGDWFPPGFVEAVGHTLVLLRAVVAVGLVLAGLLIWNALETRWARTEAHEDADDVIRVFKK